MFIYQIVLEIESIPKKSYLSTIIGLFIMIKPFLQIFVVGACLRRSPNVTDQIGILVFVIDKSVGG